MVPCKSLALGTAVLCVVFLGCPVVALAQAVKAFPTAEGYGANAVGGRGGVVYKVTNLNDSGGGSLRQCMEASGARTCVFTVSGTIVLQSPISVNNGFLTVAGQTAPNSGIQLKNASGVPARIGLFGNHIIMRHLKVRPGVEGINVFDNNLLAIQIGFGTGSTTSDIILDHVEVDWSGYLAQNFYGAFSNVTIQWSIFASGIIDPPPEPIFYGYGTIITQYDENFGSTLSFHHNLLQHHGGRVPQFAGTGTGGNLFSLIDFRNNYIYGWRDCTPGTLGGSGAGQGAGGDGPFNSRVNFVGNKYVFNPTFDLSGCTFLYLGGNIFNTAADTRVYVLDNSTPYCTGTPNCSSTEWHHRWVNDRDPGNYLDPASTEGRFRVFSLFNTPPVTTHTSAQLESILINGGTGAIGVGPRRPLMDSVTSQHLTELANKTGTFGQTTGWPTLTTGGADAPTDTDGDGIPDAYETGTLGTNPNNGADGATITASGYSNLELYINALAGDGTTTPPAGPQTYYLDVASVGGTCNDGNAGTVITSPKCTFAALQPLLVAGDTVYFRQGTYPGIRTDTTPGFASGTSATNRITFAAYQNETVILVPNGDTVLLLRAFGGSSPNELRHLHFDKLILDGQQAAGVNDVLGLFGNVTFVRFTDVRIRNGFLRGIHGNTAADLHFVGAIIHNNGVGQAQGHGVFLTSPRTIIEQSEIFDNGGYGIRVYNPGCNQTLTTDPTCSDDMVFQKNRIYNHTASGGGGASLNHGKRLRFENNLVYNNGVGVDLAENSLGIDVFHNTIYGNTTGVQVSGGTIQGATNAEVRSNLLFNNSTPLQTVNMPVGLVQSDNETANPTFVAPMATPPDFHLTLSSVARNRVALSAGVCLTAVDFAGVTRPQGGGSTPCDIGAYEFVESGQTLNDIYLSAGGHGDTPTDNNSCLQAENIATPKGTWAGACSCLVVPGKRVLVRGGTYSERIDTLACPVTGGTAGTPTTVEGYQSETAIFALPVGQTLLLHLQGTTNTFLAFKKLTFDAMTRTGSTVASFVSPAQNIIFDDVIFRNATTSCVHLNGATAITLRGHATPALNALRIHACGLAGVLVRGTVDSLRLERALIDTTGTQGLDLAVAGGSHTNTVVSQTRIHTTGTGGASAAVDIGPGAGMILQNNLLHDNNAGVRVRSGASSVQIDNNTVPNNTNVGLQCDSGASTVQVRNNISFLNGTNALVNNCSAGTATNLFTDPLFTNAGADDYTLQVTSPGVDNGTALAHITVAFDGGPRPLGPYDIGAYETQAPPPPEPPVVPLPPSAVQALMFF